MYCCKHFLNHSYHFVFTRVYCWTGIKLPTKSSFIIIIHPSLHLQLKVRLQLSAYLYMYVCVSVCVSVISGVYFFVVCGFCFPFYLLLLHEI